MKLWAERQTQLISHRKLAYSSQNHLIFANYFNYYFSGKVGKLKQEMPTMNSEQLYSCIKKQIMKVKQCKLAICTVSVGEVERLLLSINNDKPPGIDNLDGKLLRMVADSIATPICHIFNLSLEESLCPQAWREAKVIPLPKSGKSAFAGSNSRPISLVPALNTVGKNCVCYFSVNKTNHRLSACL